MYRLEFSISRLPDLTNKRRVHWTKLHREARVWKTIVLSKIVISAGRPSRPLSRATLTLTRFSSSEPDFDGLVGSFKNVIDGLVEHGVLENDRRENIGQPSYLWEKASPGKGKISVVVEEIADERSAS